MTNDERKLLITVAAFIMGMTESVAKQWEDDRPGSGIGHAMLATEINNLIKKINVTND